MKNNSIKTIITMICVFAATGLCWLLFCMCIYQEKTYDMGEYMSEEYLHDFILQDGVITSTSWDPWITLAFGNNRCVKTVDIEIVDISEENVAAGVFAVGHNWNWERVFLKTGNNSLDFHYAWDSLSFLRLDLAEKTGISMRIGNVVINSHSRILKIAMKEAFLLSLGMSLFYLTLLFLCSHFWKNVCMKIKADISSLIVCINNKENTRKFWRLVLKIWVIYVVAVLAILKADFLYIDDLRRNYSGVVSDWSTYSRYIAEFVCKLMSADNIVTDTSPLNQILTMLFMAIGVSIVIKCMANEQMSENLIVFASIPFAISPYFMENISYKIECIVHGTTVLFSTLPLLLYKKRNWQYVLLTAISITCMCTTYQGGTGIFPIIVIMLIAIEWNRGEKLENIWKLFWTSILGFGLGLVCFRVFIMKQFSGHVSSDLLPIKDLVPGFIKNVLTYYATVVNDFKLIWLVIILVIIGSFTAIFTIKSVHGKFVSFAMAWLVVGLIAIMTHGIYPLLQQCVYEPRHMFALGVSISLFCIYVVNNGGHLCRIACMALGWCFITFSYTYGNCLAMQQEYTDVKIQAVINYLNENYESDKCYNLELQNSIGLAPAIMNKTEECNILGKLVPQTLGGGWIWSEYKLYRYYDIPANFTAIWAKDENSPDIPSTRNLPLKDSTIWFDVFGDDENILISFK